jgi:predicted nucleotidyltransferase
MALALAFALDRDRLAEICRRYHVASLDVFGSRAQGTARADSDVDLLVSFAVGHIPGFAFVALAEELEACLGHPVDLLVREDVEDDRDALRRRRILAHVESIYAA